MSAEIVVVVDQQDSRSPVLFAVEERGRQSTHTRSDDDEVVHDVIGFRRGPPIYAFRERHLVGDFERTRVAAPQGRERRWVGGSRVRAGRRRKHARSDGHADATEKISACDRAVHA